MPVGHASSQAGLCRYQTQRKRQPQLMTSSEMPAGKVVCVDDLGLSRWCDTTRIDVETPDGNVVRFFEKVRPKETPVGSRTSFIVPKPVAQTSFTEIQGTSRLRAHESALGLRDEHPQLHTGMDSSSDRLGELQIRPGHPFLPP
jgi:hypothetical protein